VLDLFNQSEELINKLLKSKKIEDPLRNLPTLVAIVAKEVVPILNSMLDYIPASSDIYQYQAAKLFNLITSVQSHWGNLWFMAIMLSKDDDRSKILREQNPSLVDDLRNKPLKNGEESELLHLFKMGTLELYKLSYKENFKSEYEIFCQEQLHITPQNTGKKSGCAGVIILTLLIPLTALMILM
ncbi:MAG: hypothetical protein R3Y68_07405, partial [Rikenellaceae bacterium]